MNTEIKLMYVDADNYKKTDRVVLAGEISADQIERIQECLDDGEFLIAHQLGLPSPVEQMEALGEADHVWTTMTAFQHGEEPSPEDMLTQDAPTLAMTVDQFVAAIEAVEWDTHAEMERLGLSTDMPEMPASISSGPGPGMA